MQIANPSLDGVALPIGLCLDQLFAVSVGAPNQFHINAVAKTPKSVDELGQAKSELECPVSKAITNNKLTSDQKALVLDMCAGTVLSLPCPRQSLVVAPMWKQHFLCPVTPVLSIMEYSCH